MSNRTRRRRTFRFTLTIILFLFILSDLYIGSLILTAKKEKPASQPVSSAQEEARRIALDCENSQKGFIQCTFGEFFTVAKNHPFSYSLQTIQALETMNPQARDCHLNAHAVAIVEIEKDPKSWQEFLKNIRADYCTGGFIHGTIEGSSRYDPKFTLNSETLPKICEIIKQSVKGGGGDQYCAHITGHVLLAEKDASIPEAVKVCDNVPKNIQYQCYGGLFMENITRKNLIVHGLGQEIPITEETTANQEKLCRQYEGTAALGCWREISHMYVLLANDDPEELFKSCSRTPTPTDRNHCYLHGAGLIVREAKVKRAIMVSLCNPFLNNERLFLDCVGEMIATLLSASTNYADRARNFCEGIPEKYQKSCFATLERFLGTPESPRDD